jgi:hypothetical protein
LAAVGVGLCTPGEVLAILAEGQEQVVASHGVFDMS